MTTRLRITTYAFLLLAALLGSSRPASAQIDFDIVGFWDQPALGTVLGSNVAGIFGFEEDTVERADGTRVDLAATGRVEVGPGDAFVIETPGGGGYGSGN